MPKQETEKQETLRPWETPSITFLGDVKFLVRGGGKTGPNLDSDPQSTSKSGTG